MEEKKKVIKEKKVNHKIVATGGLVLIITATALAVFIATFLSFRYIPFLQLCITGGNGAVSETSESLSIVVTEEERNIIDVVEHSSPSVVSIAVTRLSLTQEQGLVDESSNIGTGFIVDESGLVVTNQHVVSDLSADYKVVTEEGDEYEVEEIIRDDLNDIALVKINPNDTELKALTLGDSDALLVGQSVIAIGTPLGKFAGSVTTGVVSGLNRSVTTGTGWFGSISKTYDGVIQTDAAVNPGNSGGPLLNSQGEVIGINFATTSTAENISFAIPINKVFERLEEYRTYGKFIRPYLGVTYQMISEFEALYYSNVVPGALVLRVEVGSPAYDAGMRRGDIITRMGEHQVQQSLVDIIQKFEVGESIEVEALREGELFELTVVLGEME